MSDVYVCSKFSNWLKLKVYILHWFKTFIFSSNMIGTGGNFFYYLNHVSYLPETIFCIDLKLLSLAVIW